jgi:pyruvate,orthophosphate dikinase
LEQKGSYPIDRKVEQRLNDSTFMHNVKSEPNAPVRGRLPIPSDALQTNWQRTVSPGHIPPEQELLLEIVKDKVGVRQHTESLLHEVNHPYANWEEIVEPLRTRALGDFYDYDEHGKGPEAFSIFFGLLLQCLQSCPSEDGRVRTFATLFDFMELILLEARSSSERNQEVVQQVLSHLQEWLLDEPLFAAKATTKINRVAQTVLASESSFDLERLALLYLHCLEKNYETWLSHRDLAEWFLSERDRLFGGRDYQSLLLSVSHQRLQSFLDVLPTLRDAASLDPASALRRSFELADFSQIEQGHLRIAFEMEKRSDPMCFLDKTHFLLHLLEIPVLADQNETILRELGNCIEKMRDQDPSVWPEFLRDVFRVLRENMGPYGNTVLDSAYTIGQEIYRSENRELIDLFLDQVIRLGFERPNIQGVNRDWQVVANPLHLKNVRVWLSLIQMNPAHSRRLISALIIHLKMGGVFVSDTDLFQKVISSLLSADIRACYAPIKALARLFPVYFHDIGAEGELRDVSTAVDELCNRQDLLIHFLRKQSHVESNNQILPFMEKIMEYWLEGDKEVLRTHLPEEIYEQIPEVNSFREEMAPLFRRIFENTHFRPRDLLALSDRQVLDRVTKVRRAPKPARRKAVLVIRLYQLLVKKYTIHHQDILNDLRASNFFESSLLDELEDSLTAGDGERSLERIHSLLSTLRENIVSPEESLPHEEIYRKRHIAAGIPSMYGRYAEKRFDSLGLTFRLESLAEVLFEQVTSKLNLEYVTRSTLEKAHKILNDYKESLRLDGISVEALASNLDLLKHALESRRITVDQYLNIFQFIARTVKEIIQTQHIGFHESNLRTVISQLINGNHPLPFTPAAGSTAEQLGHQASEWFIRDYLATRYCIQSLDNFVGKILAGLAQESQSLDRKTRTLLLSYNPERCFFPFDSNDITLDTQIYLGNKGYFLKCLRSFGYPVPPGFVVTTEFFRCRSAILAYDAAEEDFRRRLRNEVSHLEEQSGKRFGDPRNPLLLSVRSGSTFTMPGMMDTFLNIGINDEIVASMANQPGFAWAAWDNYRRFLQCWGMSHGIPRDPFDELMSTTKRVYSARYKRELLPEQMREVVHAYKRLLKEAAVAIPWDPWKQLETAIHRVLASWRSDTATLYRQAMKIADEWGTAVVVQKMVFGNVDTEAGTGVVFTRNPRRIGPAVTLHGDYTVCAQGEDVVSGLVATCPISEEQRKTDKLPSDQTLETQFPQIYASLQKLAEDLVYRRGFNHQDIEFTFESPKPDSLYVLQTRDMVPPEKDTLRVFLPTSKLHANLVGTGIGVGGGAMSGVAVHRMEEVDVFRRRYTGAPLIMIRPDTVPDDIELMLKVDGVLTARGGSSSHAAVAAYRLGKTCVVGCRQLRVTEKLGRSVIRNHAIRSGDWIGLDGHNGFIYVGRHETMPVHEHP